MRIAYLMHYMKDNFEEITENLDTLIHDGDDVFIMVNQEELRDDLVLSYCDTNHVHIAHHQQTALPGDMSLPRGFLILMKDALGYEEEDGFEFDRFVVMTDGMIPIVSRKTIVDYFEEHKNEDIYYVEDDSNHNPDISKRFESYAFFTNSYDFQKSKMIQAMNKVTSNVVHTFKQRTLQDPLYLSYPWFVLTHESTKILVENLAYCSNTFKMCLYPEELALATMLKKFSNVKHLNINLWACADGTYHFEKPIQNVTREALQDKFFAASVHSDDNFDIYKDYFDAYIQ